MRYSNKQLLEQMLSALKKGIMPELPMNANTQVALGVLMLSLEELLKRETVTQDYLQSLLPEGLALAHQQLAVLQTSDSTEIEGLQRQLEVIESESPQPDNVAGLHRKYNALIELLEASAKALVAQRQSVDLEVNREITSLLRQMADWEYEFYKKQLAPLPTQSEVEQPESRLDREPLEAFIRKQLPDKKEVRVENIKRILGGFGKETWFFDLVTEEGLEPLVLRRNGLAGGSLTEGPFRMVQEFALVSIVFREGVRVAEPLWFGSRAEPGIEEDFYVVRRVNGRPMGTFMKSNEDIPERVWLQAAEQLARLHRIPIARFDEFFREFYDESMVGCTQTRGATQYIDWWYDKWQDFKRLSSPMEVYMFDWLQRNMPDIQQPACVVHGDYGAHNMMYDGENLTAILDWEGTLFGMPAMDLAYVKKWVTETMDWQKFIDHYEACGGPRIDESAYSFANAYVYARTNTGTNAASASFIFNEIKDYKDTVLGMQFWPEMMKVTLSSMQQQE